MPVEGTPLTHHVSPASPTCCSCGSVKLQTLWLAFFSYTIFASGELAAYFSCCSYMLLGDALAMYIDAATYLLNIRAEVLRSKAWRTAAVTGSIVGLLIIATVMIALVNARLKEDGTAEIGWQWAFGFSLANLAIDLVMIAQLLVSEQYLKVKRRQGIATNTADPPDRYDGESQQDSAHAPDVQWWKDPNFLSALVHILADTLRAISAVAGSTLIASGDKDAEKIDATSSLVASGFTATAALFLYILYAILPDPFAAEVLAVPSVKPALRSIDPPREQQKET